MLRYERIILDSHKYAPQIYNVHERKLKMRNQLCVPANILMCMHSDKSLIYMHVLRQITS